MSFSTTQLDKLGQRLKDGQPSDDDLRMLDEYRRSFEDASSTVSHILRNEFGLQPTARPAKSTKTIVDKLRRQQTRLTRIQDIAGCRVIVRTLAEQKDLAANLRARFSGAKLIDRVESPNHGYRACHVVVKIDGRLVEIQVRTELQHLWAAISEKVADRHGHEIKYGAGPEDWRTNLLELSNHVHDIDLMQDTSESMAGQVRAVGDLELIKTHEEIAKGLNEVRDKLRGTLKKWAESPNNQTGEA